MIEMKHTPGKYTDKVYTIIGDNIQKLIDYCIPKIRNQSQENYKKYLAVDLINKSESIIDQHAGMGNFYIICLKKGR